MVKTPGKNSRYRFRSALSFPILKKQTGLRQNTRFNTIPSLLTLNFERDKQSRIIPETRRDGLLRVQAA